VILWLESGGDGLEVAGVVHLLGVVAGGDAGAGEDVEAEVAAAFGPFVVLFGQDGADEADEGVAVGEDADDVGSPAYFPVEAFLYPALAVRAS
jgi:hypothetical protein